MFLNGLITNDMKTLAVNRWMTAAFPNVQGRLLAVVRIINRGDGFLIDTEAVTHEKVLRMLDRFTLAGDFRVTDISDQMATLSLQGNRAADIVRSLFGEAAAGIEHQQVIKGGDDVTLIRATHTGEDGFDLFVGADGVAALRDRLTESGAELLNAEAEEVLRIEAGLPRYGVDMDESTIVTETNLDDAVSFTKGCYLGQEIIVRIKHRGHVAKKLAGIVAEGEAVIAPGAKLLASDEKEIGRVTSSTFSPILNRTVALGYLKYDYLAAGTEVKVGTNSFAVAELPLVRGSWIEQTDQNRVTL